VPSKKNPFRYGTAGVVAHKSRGGMSFETWVCERPPRLRRRGTGTFSFLAQPPLLYEEGNTQTCNSFTPSSNAPAPNYLWTSMWTRRYIAGAAFAASLLVYAIPLIGPHTITFLGELFFQTSPRRDPLWRTAEFGSAFAPRTARKSFVSTCRYTHGHRFSFRRTRFCCIPQARKRCSCAL